MPASERAPVLAVLAAVLLSAGTLAAQNVTSECVAVNVSGHAPSEFNPVWLVGHPDSVYTRMVPRMARDEWLLLADSVLRDFDRDTVALPGLARAILHGQLDSVRRELEVVTRGGDFARFRALGQGVKTDRFRERVIAGSVQIFLAFGTPLAIDSTWSSRQRRAVCGRTIAMRRFLTAYGELGRAGALRALQLSAARWDNLASNGYFMYPWELAINSRRFDPKSDDPPIDQWVVGHPAIGLEFIDGRVNSLNNFQPLQTMTVEVGYLRYSDSRAYYSGVTGFIAIPSDEVAGAGVMLHLHPKFKIGHVWRARGPGHTNRNGYLVTTDLAQMLAAAPQKLRDVRSALGQRIEASRSDALNAARER